MFFLLVAVF